MSIPRIKRPQIVHNLELLSRLLLRAEAEWVVIHTNPKCETRARDGLLGAGLLAFLPMEQIERRHGRGRKVKPAQTYTVIRPMFPRYLFAGMDRRKGQSVDQIRACDGVKGVLSFDKTGAVARVAVGDLIKILELSHGTFEGRPVADGQMADVARLKEGAVVKLVKGSWCGQDLTVTGYDAAKERVTGELTGSAMRLAVTAPLDAVIQPEVAKRTR